MQPLSPEEERQRGLTRERLVEAALQLVNEEGLDGLSMRALADKLDVKAASLYWHVRDRQELMTLLGEAILDSVPRPRQRPTWRETVLAVGDALGKKVAAQKDANRILLEAPEALARSDTFAEIKSQLQSAGLRPEEAADLTLMAMTYVITGRSPSGAAAGDQPRVGAPASIAIDTGSRGVILRAGPADMQALIRVPPDQSGAAPAVVRGEEVVVRRLRGVGRGEIELNPNRPWNVKVQSSTWNTVLDLAGLDVRMIHVDSGTANLECFLPVPRGAVPIHISSGVVNVALHRAVGAEVVAIVHTGVLKLRLDDHSSKVTVVDLHWQSRGGLAARDRYDLDVSSGVVDFALDTFAPKVAPVHAAPAQASAGGTPVAALEILLDGVEARVQSRSS